MCFKIIELEGEIMEIRTNYSCRTNPYFGIKVPTITALEGASGCFLNNCKLSNKRQAKLLFDLTGLDPVRTNKYPIGDIYRLMRKQIIKQHPELGEAGKRIQEKCAKITRTFLPEDEIIFKQVLKDAVKEEIKKLGTRKVELEPFNVKELYEIY